MFFFLGVISFNTEPRVLGSTLISFLHMWQEGEATGGSLSLLSIPSPRRRQWEGQAKSEVGSPFAFTSLPVQLARPLIYGHLTCARTMSASDRVPLS